MGCWKHIIFDRFEIVFIGAVVDELLTHASMVTVLSLSLFILITTQLGDLLSFDVFDFLAHWQI